MIPRAPLPPAANSKLLPPKRVPYWLIPPPSKKGVLTCPTKISSLKPRARKARDIRRWNVPNAGRSSAQEQAVATMILSGLVHVPGGNLSLVASQAPSFTLPSKSMNCVRLTKKPPSIAASQQLLEFHPQGPVPS